MSEGIIVEKIGKAAVIKFNRPETKNPLSVEILAALDQIIDEIHAEDSIGVIIFTGAGDTFAAGANLNEVSRLNSETAREFGLRGQNLMRKIYRSPKMTCAAIDGFCMGGALDLALSCKRRVASPRSIFAHPGASLGIITGWGGTQLLPRLIGKKKAFEMFLTAKKISAAEALEIKLIDALDENPLAYSLAN